MNPKKGDLVYLPSDIMLIDNMTVKKWIKLDEPTLAVMVEPQVNKNDIYHKVHVKLKIQFIQLDLTAITLLTYEIS